MAFQQHFVVKEQFPNTPLMLMKTKMKTANGVTQEIVKSSQVATVVIDEQIALVTPG